MKELIRKFVEAYGPSGNEEQIRKLIAGEITPHVDEVRVDALGNLIAVKRGKGGKKIMLAAHMDEIGGIITHIDDKGFLRFASVGGTNPHILLAERVVFENGTIGVLGREHMDDLKELRHSKMFVDIGASSREEAAEKVSIGDTFGFWRHMDDLGDFLVAKAMDDRIAAAILVQAARELKETIHEVYFVFTVQEEVGLRGARTAAYGINPDLGIAVDVCGTGDTPKAYTMDVACGNGAAIKIKDNSLMVHPKVKELLIGVAKQHNIKYQLEILEYGGTDAGAIHITREGVPSGCISIPTRYIHTPSEMVNIHDVRACVDLVVKTLETREINL
ncbi:MAG: M42 family metallopeptidase [Bacillota bacterium]